MVKMLDKSLDRIISSYPTIYPCLFWLELWNFCSCCGIHNVVGFCCGISVSVVVFMFLLWYSGEWFMSGMRTLCRHCHKIKSTGKDGLCDGCRSKFKGWDTYQRFKGSTVARYGKSWYKLRQRILERDNYLCQSCLMQGRYVTATDVDHIVPIAHGGTDDESNLQSLCHECHKVKTAKERLRR